MPEKKRVVVGGKPVIIGTRKVAPIHCGYVLETHTECSRPGKAFISRNDRALGY
jgi:hypothetical protein